MNKKLLSIALVSIALVGNAQQLTNNGFETWSGNVPASWGTMDAALVSANPLLSGSTFVTKSSTPHSGSFAATITTSTIPFIGTAAPGILEYGTMAVNISTQSATFTGLPFTTLPTTATYYIMGTLAANDTALTSITLTKWNGTSRDTVGQGYEYIISGVSSTYAMHTITINYKATPAVAPDSIQYLILSSIKNPAVVGTSITVDDINLSGSAAGVESHSTQAATVRAYPNPAVNQITLASSSEKAKYAKVYDLTGRMMNTQEFINKAAVIDLNAFENGMYLYTITDENNHILNTSKFSVSK